VRLGPSLVLEGADRVVTKEELGKKRDREVDLSAAGRPDQALLDEAVTVW
jgi:hypothetical protein